MNSHLLSLFLNSLLLIFSFSAFAATTNRGTAYKNSSGVTTTFPDVCKTPSPTPPGIPIPYPVIDSKSSDIKKGTKRTVTGKSMIFKRRIRNINGQNRTVLELKLLGAGGRPIRIRKSTLFKLTDGSYCAVCISGNRITRIMKLYPARRMYKKPANKHNKLVR